MIPAIDGDGRFRVFPDLNDLPQNQWLGASSKLRRNTAERFFSGERLPDKVVRLLTENRVLKIKEILENFEFFERARKTVKSPIVADLCCGHGLAGLLFGIFERSVEQVILVDKMVPESRAKLIEVLSAEFPWLGPKVREYTQSIYEEQSWNTPGAGIICAHACGVLTDRCLELAVESGGPIAVMPCCYPRKEAKAPAALVQALGEDLAFDIDRTYRLEAAGYQVKWKQIPSIITPKNRIVVAKR